MCGLVVRVEGEGMLGRGARAVKFAGDGPEDGEDGAVADEDETAVSQTGGDVGPLVRPRRASGRLPGLEGRAGIGRGRVEPLALVEQGAAFEGVSLICVSSSARFRDAAAQRRGSVGEGLPIQQYR